LERFENNFVLRGSGIAASPVFYRGGFPNEQATFPPKKQKNVGRFVSTALLPDTVSLRGISAGTYVYLSLCEYNYSFDPAPVFRGLSNYVNMFKDGKFLISLGNTVKFAVVDFILMMVISLLLALTIFFKGRHTRFFQTTIFMPIVVPASLVCIIFTWLLSQDFGLLNKFIVEVLNRPDWALPWLTDKSTALWSLLSVNLWCNIGFETILFLAGLQSISPDILEAANVDGATGLKKIIHVILPNLSQTYVITGIWATVAALKVFVEPMVMTNGAPALPHLCCTCIFITMHLSITM
jgi:ABC-type sugar transport system permease subunit